MTDIDIDTDIRRTPEWAYWTRRIRLATWGSAALIVLLVAGVVVWTTVRSADDEYGPVSNGMSFGGVSPGVVSGSHGLSQLVTTGNRTAHVFSSMGNRGSHSVVVTGIDLDDVTVGAEWAPDPPELAPDAPEPQTRWRAFPMTLKGYQQVRLRYAIRRPPRCQDEPMNPAGGQIYSDIHTAHWESLLGDHTTMIGAGSPFLEDSIQVC